VTSHVRGARASTVAPVTIVGGDARLHGDEAMG
jgi:hypothetical protein